MEVEEKLLGVYDLKVVEDDEFARLFEKFRPIVFADYCELDIDLILSEQEKLALTVLSKRAQQLFRLNLCIYAGQELVGWSFGRQEGRHVFHMINTGILPEFQGKGIYTALLPHLLMLVKAQGFQVVNSYHLATNNRIIIAKLKAGFQITGLHLSDEFGTLVQLSYYFNEQRREALKVRSGQSRPTGNIRHAMGI